ncbi:MAG TPA: NAD(P)/FAD-dependent oxidoreductase [Myxococcota bacterium]|jgi:4-hydroxyacetophenone monooxygenase
MDLSRPTFRITESNEKIQRALAEAQLPSLLPALVHLTGDLSLLRDDLRLDTTSLVGDPSGFLGGEPAAARARELALNALAKYRDAGCPAPKAPSDDLLRGILKWIQPDANVEPYLPLIKEELSVGEADLRAPTWHKDQVARSRDFRVAIIGAGMSGLLAAHRLQQAGVPCVVLEKNAEVGGTWYENTYPGCRVDVANSFFSYSFAQKSDWPNHYSTQPALLSYFRECADRFGLRKSIRFDTEVLQASWQESRALWSIRVRKRGGQEEVIEANALISAVGQLNQPNLPEIEGRQKFAGRSWHSARWNHAVDLKGKRVAVIGTGATAAQFVPVIAEQVARLDVYQRTPNWLLPALDYHAEIPAGQRWLFSHVPHAGHWHRIWLFWRTGDGMFLPRARVDRSWTGRQDSVSAGNEELRTLLAQALREQLADRPDLIPKVVPNYPPASKRILVDNGVWCQALKRPNVNLITDGIREITASGVVTKDGTERPADVIIYATGFQASKFLTPMQVLGRDGADLHKQWDGNARAYLGLVAPNFPNFFFMYGPNTNIVVNGSIIYFSECEMHYIVNAIRLLLEQGKRSLDCKRDVHDRYNTRIDQGNLEMAWGVSKVSSWYKSASGRVAQNWPFTLLEYWQQTRAVNPADYVLS